MKIAIASDGNKVSAHFGHCEGFSMYEVKKNKVLNNEFVPNPGHRPGFLPMFLKDNKVDLIISGGMGGSAQELFVNNGIDVIVGAEGSCEDVMNAYIKGELKSTDAFCEEHNH